MRPRMRSVFPILLAACGLSAAGAAKDLELAEFLPAGYVTDGSVSYQREVQQAIDAAAAGQRRLILPPMKYLVDEQGWQLRSGLCLEMHGAVFLLDAGRKQDGAVFR